MQVGVCGFGVEVSSKSFFFVLGFYELFKLLLLFWLFLEVYISFRVWHVYS